MPGLVGLPALDFNPPLNHKKIRKWAYQYVQTEDAGKFGLLARSLHAR